MSQTPAGTIAALFSKPKIRGEAGLPKRPLLSAEITAQGLVGDHNHYRHRRCGDDPDMALLLLPASVLPAINAVGFPVQPGNLGENVLLAGVENDALAVGQIWALGAAVLAQISRPCDPCRTLARLPYVGRERLRAFMRATLGQRGWYARVLAPGQLWPGDAARLGVAP